jgi:hypothetical protein
MRTWICKSHALFVHILFMNIHDWSTDTEYKSSAHITSYMSKFILSTFLPTKWKKTKYYTVGTIPKSNIKIVERGKIDTTNTQIYYPEHTNVIKMLIVYAAPTV